MKILSDLPYLGAERREKLDVYLPDPEKFPGLRPSVVVIHGGGWAIGDKATVREKDICSTFASAGYAAFSINYTLIQYEGKPWQSRMIKSAWPDNLWDCSDAVRYVRINAKKYSIDPNRIAVLGASAGGHLALLVGLAPDSLKTRSSEQAGASTSVIDQSVSSGVNCIISMYAPHDLRMFGGECFPSPDGSTKVRDAASPTTYMQKPGRPVLIIHGDKDTTVKPELAKDLDEKLTQAGIEHELVWVPGAGHSFHLHPPEKNLEPIVLKFLAKHMQSQ